MKLQAIIEAILFVSVEPVSISRLVDLTGAAESAVRQAVSDLEDMLSAQRRGIRLHAVAEGYHLRTAPDVADLIQQVAERPPNLTNAALETAAIIAYRQPITRAEIESIRGVRSDHALSTLVSYGLITAVGRHDTPGRPILYGTTPVFLQWCGLNSLDDLPDLAADDADTTQQTLDYTQ